MANATDTRTAIIIACIPVAGAIAVGMMANWDKLFPRQPAAPAVMATQGPRPDMGNATPLQHAVTSVDRTADTPASHASASADIPASAIAGAWHDDDGFTYRFSADGGHVSYVQLLDGEPVGSGDGTIAGRTLRYRYVDARTNDRGTCEGRLAAGGKVIDGRCGNGGNSWGFKIVRDGA